MKKIIVVFALTLTGACTFSQTAFEAGLRLNPEFTFLLNKNDENVGTQLDYANHFGYLSFGAGGVYNISGHLGLALDILFSREGQAFKGVLDNIPDSTAYSSIVVLQKLLANDTLIGNYTALAELNFIKIPLMLSFSTLRVKPVFFNLMIGPQINILQGVAQEVDGVDHEYSGTNIKPKDLYMPFTIDGMIAVGAGFRVTPHLILAAHLRFDYGFSDVEKKDATISYSGMPPVRFYSTGRAATHNATAALMIALNVRLGKIIKNGPYQTNYPK